MNETHTALWQKIKRFELDDPASAFSFSDRLARENDWDIEFALRAICEYKRFMFLTCIADHPLTPSDEIDQVWHLHLLYTRSYWDAFCDGILGRKIHHGPTQGGKSEAAKFDDWYNKTLELYRATFRTNPPADLWPPSEKRFGDTDFKRVNVRRNWIIQKPNFI